MMHIKCDVVVLCITFIIVHSFYVSYHMKFKDFQIGPRHDVNLRINYLESATSALRKQLFRAVCEGSSQVSDTGAWCLFPKNATHIQSDAKYFGHANSRYGYPIAPHHLAADEGVARTIA